jgi:hypothetical protein
MTPRTIISATMAFLAIIATSIVFAVPASADNGVTVFNPGNNPNSCVIGGFGGTYGSSGVVVFDQDGLKMYRCSGPLISGTPVSDATIIRQNGCTWVFTPGREASVTCPHGF